MTLALLAEVRDRLRESSVGHAVVGAAALALYGVTRATWDVDLIAADEAPLSHGFFDSLPKTSVEVRRGDSEDPLLGVVRLARDGQRPIDLIVGRASWMSEIPTRAELHAIDAISVPVARASDLALLKLFAGGPQDLWDIQQLLLADPEPGFRSEVESRLAPLPDRCREAWASCIATGQAGA